MAHELHVEKSIRTIVREESMDSAEENLILESPRQKNQVVRAIEIRYFKVIKFLSYVYIKVKSINWEGNILNNVCIGE